MLQLILGTAGVGKTQYILDEIARLAKMGEKCTIIVPEQFSKTTESLVYQNLQSAQFSLVSVNSFSSLIRNAQKEKNLSLPKQITTLGKAVLINKAVKKTLPLLNTYKKQSRNMIFNYSLSEVFDDFKRSGISSEDFFNTCSKGSEKLKELALIYSQYTQLLNDDLCDEEEILLFFSENMPEDIAKDTNIFIDSFESFSYGQEKIIQTFIEKAKSVTVCITSDDMYTKQGSPDSFLFTKNTINSLVSKAKQANESVKNPIILKTAHRFNTLSMKNIDLALRQEEIEEKQVSDTSITAFENQYSEVCFTLAKINELTKKGYSYNDIAVVVPDLAVYENQLQESFSLADIPYFIDQNRIISSCSAVLVFSSILDVLKSGINKETIMNVLKTRLTNFSDEDIDLLENYIFVWQDYELDFFNEFNLSPKGLEKNLSKKDSETLKRINALKDAFIKVITENFDFDKEYTTSEILTILYEISTAFGVNEEYIKTINEAKDTQTKELLKEQWEKTILILDELYNILKDEEINAKEIKELFDLMVLNAQIGFSPQTQDCVMISTPQRMKLTAVKACFVLGAVQDVFPKVVSDDNILNLKDKEFLKENDILLKSSFDNLYNFENFYFYKTLTTPKEKLFISFAKNNLGKTQILSSQTEALKESLDIKSEKLEIQDYLITKEFFKDYILQTENEDVNSTINLLNSLDIDVLELKQREFLIKQTSELKEFLGDVLQLSPSKTEDYFKCPFMFFLSGIFRLYSLEKANFSQRNAGDYLHFIAYKILLKYKGEYPKTDFSKIKKDVLDIVDEYINENYPQKIIDTQQFKTQKENMQKNALELLEFIHTEQKNSSFTPIAFEEQFIGEKGLFIKAENGQSIINGVCDRIDLMQKDNENFIRIVDYKTGEKDFSLDDIYNGVQSQLLMYMSAVVDNKFNNLENLSPAAVVYQPSDISFKFDNDDAKLYIPVGMALDDEIIVEGFDNLMQGRYGVITKKGEKIQKVKGSEIVNKQTFNKILAHTKENLKNLTNEVYKGNFNNTVLQRGNGDTYCSWCSYKTICQNDIKVKEKVKNTFNEKSNKE